jgi:hypothetical protein
MIRRVYHAMRFKRKIIQTCKVKSFYISHKKQAPPHKQVNYIKFRSYQSPCLIKYCCKMPILHVITCVMHQNINKRRAHAQKGLISPPPLNWAQNETMVVYFTIEIRIFRTTPFFFIHPVVYKIRLGVIYVAFVVSVALWIEYAPV